MISHLKKEGLARRLKAREVDAVVGANIRKFREHRDMTQRELAKRLGITFQQIQKFEAGTNRVSAGRLFQLSEALGVPIVSFFEQKGRRRIKNIEDLQGLSSETLELAMALEHVDNRKVKKAIRTILEKLHS